jgi:hypothetical protein
MSFMLSVTFKQEILKVRLHLRIRMRFRIKLAR